MNKAFVREPDEPDHLKCPRCTAIGLPVSPVTLAANLAPDDVRQLGVSAAFCPSPSCPIAYFDAHAVAIPASRLLRPAYPKHPDAPLCPCLGLTAADLQHDAERGDPKRIRDLLKHAASPAADCPARTPSGRRCTADAQKLYLRHHRPR